MPPLPDLSGTTTVPGGDTTTPSGQIGPGTVVEVTGASGGLNIRSGPGTSYDILATVPNGGSVQVVASAGDGWYEITFTAVGGVTTTGYMKGEFLANS